MPVGVLLARGLVAAVAVAVGLGNGVYRPVAVGVALGLGALVGTGLAPDVGVGAGPPEGSPHMMESVGLPSASQSPTSEAEKYLPL